MVKLEERPEWELRLAKRALESGEMATREEYAAGIGDNGENVGLLKSKTIVEEQNFPNTHPKSEVQNKIIWWEPIEKVREEIARKDI